MFNKGDIVFYKNIGVCKVADIKKLDFAMNEDQKYYVMENIFKNGVNYVPVGAGIENIRNIITKEEAENLIDMIPEIEAEPILDLVTKEMTEVYEEMINSENPLDLLKLTLSIDKKKEILAEEKKKFGAIDDNYLKKAIDMLFEEIAAALGMEKENMPQYIEDRVGYKFTE